MHRRGFTRKPENSKRAHSRVPALQTPPKFHEKTPRERKKKSENGGGRGKKKREILGGPAEEGGSGRGSRAGGPAQGVSGGGNEKNQKIKAFEK